MRPRRFLLDVAQILLARHVRLGELAYFLHPPDLPALDSRVQLV